MSAACASRRTPKTDVSTGLALPFSASRRLIGPNLFFASTGAVLELAAGVEVDDALIEGWRSRVERARAHLGWTLPGVVARRHSGGASLALAAPCDQLYSATEVNEWALCAALQAREPRRWSGLEAHLVAAALEDAAEGQALVAPVLEEQAALARLQSRAAAEGRPLLREVLQAAARRALPHVLDDDSLTLGAGTGGRDFALAELPPPGAVPWGELHDIPTAVVTGSNGKTTSVRLLAACARAQGLACAYNCTDGVFLGEEMLESGDYSGPAGAWQVLRERRAMAAVVEVARGGILRRGVAVSQANVALVTNISADHFGEYGIDDLDGLADVKLTVAAVVSPGGLLILNAEDATLRSKVGSLAARFGRVPALGWFALDADLPALRAHRAAGGATCGVRGGRLILNHAGSASAAGAEHDLGAVAAMPLTVEGSATYNIANLAGAALAASVLGIAPAVIAGVFARFGRSGADNMGRMMRFERNGVRVLLDYAHNPEGLRGLLSVAEHLRGTSGRLGMLLGHAGNRQDSEIAAVAQVAAEFRPALVVVKENEAHLRGREAGEIPRLIRAELLRAGLPEAAVPLRMSELEAARYALEWARPGDVLALPVHSAAARAAVLELLQPPA
jgi:cyanophycin synthetase